MDIPDMIPEELHDLANTQAEEEERLLDKQNVNGVAIGRKIVQGEVTDDTALKVFVEVKLDPAMLTAEALVPSDVNGVPTDVVEAGVIQAGGSRAMKEAEATAKESVAGSALSLRRRIRPAQGGYSVAHTNVTAGTIATGAYDATAFPGKPARYYILSNNHVLANSNNASSGDLITQPGPFDGGTVPADVIGRLARFVPIRFHTATSAPCNFVDAAIAEVPFEDLDRQIYWIGHVRGLNKTPTVGQIVQKTGRTTNYTTGRITDINATVDVNYGVGVARFCRQIITSDMSAGGDSGSLLVGLGERAVGLLFAGSAVLTIHNPIALVLASLGIRIVET